MPPQEVRKYVAQVPFQPFRLHISDGSSYDILEPLAIHVDMLNVSVGVGIDDETGLYRKSILLAPNHITRIEPLTKDELLKA